MLIVKWWICIDNGEYCKSLCSIKAAFLELEKAMLTIATLLPMFTIITPETYTTHSKQSKTFHGYCSSKMKLWEKMSLISESDCMCVTDLNQAVRQLCHVVETFSKLLKNSHDYSLLKTSDQKVVRNVFSCFWLKNYRNIVLRYSLTSTQYFCVGESPKY